VINLGFGFRVVIVDEGLSNDSVNGK